jgi:cytochrome bd-type quinol oxidase subunit 1
MKLKCKYLLLLLLSSTIYVLQIAVNGEMSQIIPGTNQPTRLAAMTNLVEDVRFPPVTTDTHICISTATVRKNDTRLEYVVIKLCTSQTDSSVLLKYAILDIR